MAIKYQFLVSILVFSFTSGQMTWNWDQQTQDRVVAIGCDKIRTDFMLGQKIFELEDRKGEFLVRNGYTSGPQEPFAALFQGAGLPENMTEEFFRANKYIRGVQHVVDQYTQVYRNVPLTDYVSSADFLAMASKCISKHIYPRTRAFGCDTSYRYRTFDGSCNNLDNPLTGATLTGFGRLIPAVYDDNVYEERKSVVGGELISPRDIVDELFGKRKPMVVLEDLPNTGFHFWGQFITHDVGGALNTHHRGNTEDPVRCCSADYKRILPEDFRHHACAPIGIPPKDSHYSQFQYGCHNYVRSQTIFPPNGKLSAAQQVNSVNGYIDLSVVYGNTQDQSYALRTFSQGLLTTNENNVLPNDPNDHNRYIAGDRRVNQTPQLAFLHSAFYRLHNQIAGVLSALNPNWDDETIYQEARRVNIAISQHITFEEYVPILLGKKVNCLGSRCDYNSSILGTTMNEFAHAAFRFLHAYTPDSLETYDSDGNINSAVLLSETIENATLLETMYEDVAQGLIYQGINLEIFGEEIRNKLFKDTDLVSVDIKRGRDHGVAPYWRYREMCGFGTVEEFSDLYPLISYENIEILQTLYSSPRDIDLEIGLTMELQPGQLTGPTFRCLAKTQFAHFKLGDRHFYSGEQNPHPFTASQLKEIQRFSFAKLLCLTTNIQRVPVNAFFTPSENNKFVSCERLQELDLLSWIE